MVANVTTASTTAVPSRSAPRSRRRSRRGRLLRTPGGREALREARRASRIKDLPIRSASRHQPGEPAAPGLSGIPRWLIPVHCGHAPSRNHPSASATPRGGWAVIGPAGGADLVLGRQAARRPVRGVGRCALERLDHDRLDDVVADRAHCSRTRGVDEAVEASLAEAVAPLAHRHGITPQLGRDLGVGGSPRRAGQHDLGSQRQRLSDECRRAQRSSVARSSALKLISTVGRPRRAMAFLRCWRTTPEQRGPTDKIPAQPRIIGGTAFRDTRRKGWDRPTRLRLGLGSRRACLGELGFDGSIARSTPTSFVVGVMSCHCGMDLLADLGVIVEECREVTSTDHVNSDPGLGNHGRGAWSML